MDLALVTGGTSPLGQSIAYMLAKKGYGIVLHYHQTSPDSIKNEIEQFNVPCHLFQADLTKSFQLDYPIEVLVNNFGPYLTGNLQNTTLDDFNSVMKTNLYIPFRLINDLLPQLKQSKGSIINLGVAGLISRRILQKAPAYYIAKQALYELTRCYAKELVKDGVRINMISPGYIVGSIVEPTSYEQMLDNRDVTCEEISSAISFLLDPNNRYITGQNIEVAGGVNL